MSEHALDEIAVEVPVEPAVEDPTLYEQSYWDADDAAVGRAFEALLDPATNRIPVERLTKFAELTYHIAVQNRSRQKEPALKVGELVTALEVQI